MEVLQRADSIMMKRYSCLVPTGQLLYYNDFKGWAILGVERIPISKEPSSYCSIWTESKIWLLWSANLSLWGEDRYNSKGKLCACSLSLSLQYKQRTICVNSPHGQMMMMVVLIGCTSIDRLFKKHSSRVDILTCYRLYVPNITVGIK